MHEKNKHRNWDFYNSKAPKIRPFQVGTTDEQFRKLVGIAVSLGVQPAKTGRPSGQSSFVVAMIRMIAEGSLLVVHPTAQSPQQVEG